MRSKPSTRAEAKSTLARLYERGEEAIGVFVEELLGNKAFTDQLSKTLDRAFDAKKRVDRNLQTVLSLLNLPSRADYHRLQTKIEALQGSVVNISMKLDRLLAAQQRRRPAPKRARKAPPPAHHAAE